jgi:hypothetical protein
MKILLLLLISVSSFGQNLSNTQQVIYKANTTEVIDAIFTPISEIIYLSVKSTSSVYFDNDLVGEVVAFPIPLDSGDVILAKGQGYQYQLRKNGVIVNYVPTTDNSLSNIRTLAQSAVGVAIGSLTTNQVRALLAVLLWKEGGINENGRIKKLNTWAK